MNVHTNVFAHPIPRLKLIQVISEYRFLTQFCVGRITWSAYFANLQFAVKHYSPLENASSLLLLEFRRQVFPRFSEVCEFVTIAPDIPSKISESCKFVYNIAVEY